MAVFLCHWAEIRRKFWVVDYGLGRVKGAEEEKHSQASHQGSCRDVPVSLLLMPQDTAGRLASSMKLQPGLCHVTSVSPRTPAAGLASVAVGTEQTGQAAAELCSPRVAHAGLSACRAVTPERLVASPLGGEQRTGGVWIVLSHLHLSFLQLVFPLDFHLGTISSMSDGQ